MDKNLSRQFSSLSNSFCLYFKQPRQPIIPLKNPELKLELIPKSVRKWNCKVCQRATHSATVAFLLYQNNSKVKNFYHSSMVLSVPTILRPWVQIPSTPFTLFSICIIEIVIRKGRKQIKRGRDGKERKQTKKEAVVGPFLTNKSFSFAFRVINKIPFQACNQFVAHNKNILFASALFKDSLFSAHSKLEQEPML